VYSPPENRVHGTEDTDEANHEAVTVNAPPPVIDGHNDTLLDVHLADRGGGRSFLEQSDSGHIDLPRARAANYSGGFFAIFVPNDETQGIQHTAAGYEIPLADPVSHTHARGFTYDVLEHLFRLHRAADGAFEVVRTVDRLRETVQGPTVAAIPHLEGAAAVAPDLSNLDFLYEAGVRSIGLTWSRPNEFGTGVPFAYPRSPDIGPGLTDSGLSLVDACNDRGILIDLAHLNAQGFWDVAARSDAPLVVSHTAVHNICQSTRNLTDEQLDAIAATDGVVGISLCVENLHPEGKQDVSLPVETIVDHFEYVVDRIGVEHVAIGSDFDGATIPNAIGDVTGLVTLWKAFQERGFGNDELEMVTHKNWLRVLAETWR
jgi:membrane dipeptidase